MSRSPQSVVALAHHATRTGAPAVLLSLLEWARATHGVEVTTVLRRGGDVVDDFAAVGAVEALRPWGRHGLGDAVEVGLGRLGAAGVAARVTAAEAVVRSRGRLSADLAVVNGMGAAALLPAVHPDTPCAAVVHELPTTLARAATERERALLWERAGRVVAVSEAVAEALVDDEGVDAGVVRVAHEFVPDRAERRARSEARAHLGLDGPPGAPALVAGVGSGSWRKGIDLFVRVAAIVHRALGDRVRFAWVGPLDDEGQVRHDLEHLGLREVVDLVGPTDDTRPWFDAMDLFLLTSREDPFPLVVLEAGLAEVPVVSFSNGGAPEVLLPDAGVVVDYLDVRAMADAAFGVLGAEDLGASYGRALGERVRARHVTEVGAPVMWEALTG